MDWKMVNNFLSKDENTIILYSLSLKTSLWIRSGTFFHTVYPNKNHFLSIKLKNIFLNLENLLAMQWLNYESLLGTSYFLVHTSYFLVPTSYFLVPTSYFLFRGATCELYTGI